MVFHGLGTGVGRIMRFEEEKMVLNLALAIAMACVGLATLFIAPVLRPSRSGRR